MKNVYHREIMDFLIPCGADGMRVCNLVRRIYNLHCGLFVRDVNYPALYRTISRYLWTQSLMQRSPFKHIRRGYYAIKPNVAVQLDIFIDFSVPQAAEPKHHAATGRNPKDIQLTFDF